MILTGVAVKFAEVFKKLDEHLQKEGFKMPEMDEEEQKGLLQITMMYERDENFRNFMRGCSIAYNLCMIQGKDELAKLFESMKKLALEAESKL